MPTTKARAARPTPTPTPATARTKAKAKAKPRTATTKARPPAKRRLAPTRTEAPRVSTHPPKERTPAIEAVIRRVSALCLALPDVTEVVAWGEPTWRVRGKLFAMFDTHHHGNPHLSVWIAAPPGAQAALVDADPARFWRPPYVGHKGWVAIVVDDPAPPWDMIGALFGQAHELVAPAPRRTGTKR